MSRTDQIYDKPPLSLDGMIALMESRGLSFADKGAARHYLRFINYYRLSGYGYLFEEEHVAGNPPAPRPGWPDLHEGAFARYIAVLEYMLRKVAPDTGWGRKVKDLIQGEPCVDPAVLGIQNNDFWECDL